MPHPAQPIPHTQTSHPTQPHTHSNINNSILPINQPNQLVKTNKFNHLLSLHSFEQLFRPKRTPPPHSHLIISVDMIPLESIQGIYKYTKTHFLTCHSPPLTICYVLILLHKAHILHVPCAEERLLIISRQWGWFWCIVGWWWGCGNLDPTPMPLYRQDRGV